jgi:hypothetical protein
MQEVPGFIPRGSLNRRAKEASARRLPCMETTRYRNIFSKSYIILGLKRV